MFYQLEYNKLKKVLGKEICQERKGQKLAASANDAVHFAYHAQIAVKSVFTMIFIYGDRGGQGHLILKNYGGDRDFYRIKIFNSVQKLLLFKFSIMVGSLTKNAENLNIQVFQINWS